MLRLPRRSSIQTSKRIRYALGEIVLIFLGISLAIAFQNWNEQRRQTRLEGSVLRQLEVALKNDFEDVNANMLTHQKAISGCQQSLKVLSGNGQIEGSDLLQNLMEGLYFSFLVSDVSTYEYLQSVGLHIIANDTLRRQITKLYDVVYEGIYGVEKNTLFLQEDLLANIRTYYTADTIFFKPKDNLQAIRSDDQLRFNLKSVEFSHQIIFNRYQDDVVPELEKLLQMVGQELAEP